MNAVTVGYIPMHIFLRIRAGYLGDFTPRRGNQTGRQVQCAFSRDVYMSWASEVIIPEYSGTAGSFVLPCLEFFKRVLKTFLRLTFS